MSLTFRLETFGGLAVIDGVGSAVSTQRRRLALLALIAAAGRRGISRDRVLAYLWPESSAANARHALEQLLYALRRQLGPTLFLGADPLRLNQQVLTTDVAEFDEAVDRGDVAKAVTLYRGPFLDGFYLGDSGEFERWAEVERARLTQRYALCLEQLAHQANEAGKAIDAIEHWRKLVALDPVSAHATLGLLHALAGADERTEAIRQGRAYEVLARAEGAEPAPAISALLRQLLAEEPKHSRPVPPAHSSETSHHPPSPVRRFSLARFSRHLAAPTVAAVAIMLLVLAIRPRRHSVVVIGSGDAARDVAALQAAVDGSDTVRLRGHFSLAVLPTKSVDPRLASGWYPAVAEILISKAVAILGARDEQGQFPVIESGTIPFYVNAPGARVTIRGLRFIRPIQTAVLVSAVQGLEISASRIEGLVPFAHGAAGLAINTRGDVPLPSSPGNPENVSGHLLIADNEIDVTGGTAELPTAGILVFSIGQLPSGAADLDLIDNRISNATAPTIFIRHVNGRIRLLGNTLRTSPATIGDVDAVRLTHGGSILMANNTVECKWPNAAAIQVYSPFAEWPTEQVTVADNTVLMSPMPGVALGDFSAGISIRGFAHGNVIRHNTISGRAETALSMYAFRGGAPRDDAFIDNRLDRFQATRADIFVGSGVERAHILGEGSLMDRGTATIRER